MSVLLATPGYLQITPSLGGAPQLLLGIYCRTGADNSTANGSSSFQLYTPVPATFALNYNSDVTGTNVEATLSILKLNRSP